MFLSNYPFVCQVTKMVLKDLGYPLLWHLMIKSQDERPFFIYIIDDLVPVTLHTCFNHQ